MNDQKTPKLSKEEKQFLKEAKANFKAEGGYTFYFPKKGVTVGVKPSSNAQVFSPGLKMQDASFAELAAAYVGTGDTFRKSIGAHKVLDRIYFSGESVIVPVAPAMASDVYVPDDAKLQKMLDVTVFAGDNYVTADELKFQGTPAKMVNRTVALSLAQQFVTTFVD